MGRTRRLTPLSRRNPFLYSGHFNRNRGRGGGDLLSVAIPSFIQGISTYDDRGSDFSPYYSVAIPSFIQGISTEERILPLLPPMGVAIPSFIQGISTQLLYLLMLLMLKWLLSQSLPLFRAFQQYQNRDPSPIAIYQCRNPFLYSGHFNPPAGG